jgi:hypothetical protein
MLPERHRNIRRSVTEAHFLHHLPYREPSRIER